MPPGPTAKPDIIRVQNADQTKILNPSTEEKQDDIIAKMPTLEDNGGVPVNVTDQTTRPIDIRMSRTTSEMYTLAEDTTPNTYTVTLTSVVGLSAGDKMCLCQDSDNPGTYYGYIISIAGNVLTLNAPIDIVFSNDNNCVFYTIENNIATSDGSVTPVEYSVTNIASIDIDITRIILKIVCDTAPDLSHFGDLTTLTRGIVFRKKFSDGVYQNIFVARNNSEFSLLAYDYKTYDATNPAQGVYGLAARLTFAGQDKHGVAIRLSQGEELQMLVQDDLTDLIDFKIMAQGHYTNNF